MILIERALRRQDELIYADPSEAPNKSDMDIVLEATSDTYIIRDALYAQISTVLNNDQMDRKFKQLIGNFIDKNNSAITLASTNLLIASISYPQFL